MNFGVINSLDSIGGYDRLLKQFSNFSFNLNDTGYSFHKAYDTNYPNNVKYSIIVNGDLIKSGDYSIIEYFKTI